MHVSKPADVTSPKTNPNVNYGLQMIMVSQCRFINYINTTQDVDNGGNDRVRAGCIAEISVSSTQFAVNLKLL